MRKGFWSICLSVVVLVALIVVLVPGCTGEAEQGTIEVKATLCGDPWPTQGTGAVSYTLTPGTGSPVNGTQAPASFNVSAGSWTCGNVSGGPSDAFLVDITPSATQSLAEGGKITFTLNFELDQDAAIQWLDWTISGDPILQPAEYYEVHPCNVIDCHFKQWVNGCEGYQVTMNETSVLTINYLAGPAPIQIYVSNATCAVIKDLDAVKKSQVPTFEGKPVEGGWLSDPIIPGTVFNLDVHTQWQLVKCLNYTKSIRWFGISQMPFDPGTEHQCVLFELIVPPGQGYQLTLVASADVALVGATDVNPTNNHAVSLWPLNLLLNAP